MVEAGSMTNEATTPPVPDWPAQEAREPTQVAAPATHVRRRGGTTKQTILAVALTLVGLGAAVFGVVQLTAGDPEVDRLETELAELTADRDDAIEQIAAAEARAEDAAVGAEELDAALVTMADAFETFVDSYDAMMASWNLVANLPAEQLQAAIDADVMPAMADADAARDAFQNASQEAQTALTNMQNAGAEVDEP